MNEEKEQPQIPEIKDSDEFEDTGQSPRPTNSQYGSWGTITGGSTLVGVWVVTESIYPRVPQSIRIIDANTNLVQTGWTITANPSTQPVNTNVTITATPGADTPNGSYRLRVRYGGMAILIGLTSYNGPSGNVDSSAVTVTTGRTRDTIIATPTWTNVTYNGTKLSGTLTFSGANVTGISSSDFEILNAADEVQTGWTFDTISPSTTNSIGITIGVTPPSNTNGSFRLRLKSQSVRSDGSSTDNCPTSAVDTEAFIIDNRLGIIATASWSNESFSNGILQATLTFNNVGVRGLQPLDFEVVNSSGAVLPWIFYIPPTAAAQGTGITIYALSSAWFGTGSLRIRLKASSVMSGGNASNNAPVAAVESALVSVNTNTVVANATWTNIPIYIRLDQDIDATLTFNSPITGISSSDFEVINSDGQVQTGWTIGISAAPSLTAVGNYINTAVIRFRAPRFIKGRFKFRLKANSIRGLYAPSDNSPTSNIDSSEFTYNTRDFQVASWEVPSSTPINPITSTTSNFAVLFNYSIQRSPLTTSDFTTSDSGAVISSVRHESSQHYRVNITVTNPVGRSGSYTVSINPNVVPPSSDGLIHRGPPADDPLITSPVVYFGEREIVGVSSFEAQTGTQYGSTSSFILTLNRAITTGEIDISDFSPQSGSGAIISSVTGIDTVSGAATTYRIDVTNPTNSDGSYTISMARNSISGTVNYLQGPATIQTSTAVTYDTRPSVQVTSFTTVAGTQRGTTTVFRLVLNRSVPTAQITTDDFTTSITTATIDSVNAISPSNNSSATYDVTVNNPTDSSGNYTVSLNANAVEASGSYAAGPTSAYQSTQIAYNTFPFSATWGAPEFTGGKLSVPISFSHNVTGITDTDFEIVNDAVPSEIQTGWTFDTPNTSANAGSNITIAATPPANTNANFAIRIKSDSVRFDGSSTDNGPPSTSDRISNVIAVDSRPQLRVSSFTAPSSTQGSTTSLTLTLDRSVPVIPITNFTIPGNVTITISPTTGNASVYTITATNPNNDAASYRISLNTNSIDGTTTYKRGPLASDANRTSQPITYDTREAITATWSSPTSGMSNRITDATSEFTLTLNKSIPTSEITSSDFTGATISSITPVSPTDGNASVYSIITTNPITTTGSYTLSFNMNAVPDSLTYKTGPAAAVNASTLYYGPSPFTIIWETDRSSTERLLRFNISFSDNVTGLATTDFEIINDSNAIQTGWDIAFDNPSQTSVNANTKFLIKVTPPENINDRFAIRLKANSITFDSTTGPSSATPSAFVGIDNRTEIAVTSFTAPTGNQTGTTSTFSLVFDRAVPSGQLTASDFTSSLSGMTVDSITPTSGNNTTYNIMVNNPIGLDLSGRLALKQNAIDDGTNYMQGPINVFRSTTIAISRESTTATPFWTAISGTVGPEIGTIRAVLVFIGESVSGIISSDFEVVNNAGVTQTGWCISVDRNTANEFEAINVTATNGTSSIDDNFRLRLKANSLMSGASTTDNIPADNTDSDPTLIRTPASPAMAQQTSLNNRNTYTLTITVPKNKSGAMQLSVNPESFHIHGDASQEGPENRQYLGTIYYNTKTESRIAIGNAYSAATAGNIVTNIVNDVYVQITANPAIPSSEIASFTESDILVTGACKGDLTQIGTTGTTWRLHIDPHEDRAGVFTVAIPADIIEGGNEATEESFSYDTTTTVSETPTAIITSYGISGRTAYLYIYWQNATETQLNSFTINNNIIDSTTRIAGATATLGARMGGAFPITISNLPANTSSHFQITIPANSVGNNVAAESGCIPYDTTEEEDPKPSVTITSGGFDGDDTVFFYSYWENTTENALDVVGEDGFHADDISVTGADGSTVTLSARMGLAYPFRVTGLPANTNSTLKVTIRANALGADTNLETESSCIPYDTTKEKPIVTITSGGFDGNRTVHFYAYWENTTGDILDAQFTAADISVAIYDSATNTTTTRPLTSDELGARMGLAYPFSVGNLPTNTHGTIKVTIASNALGVNTNTATDSSCIPYDTRPATTGSPYLEVINLPTTVQDGTTLSLNIDAKLAGNPQNIDGLREEDFVVTGLKGRINFTLSERT